MPSATVTVRPMSGAADRAAFEQLNRHWIEQYFTITPEDDRVLSHPDEAIVEPGGAVLVAVDDEGTVIGVVALLAAGDGVFELAKITVSGAARGRGVGHLLIRSAVDRARDAGAHRVFLGTSTRLAPAIRLYERAGFTRTTVEDLGLRDYYARADILMKLDLPRT